MRGSAQISRMATNVQEVNQFCQLRLKSEKRKSNNTLAVMITVEKLNRKHFALSIFEFYVDKSLKNNPTPMLHPTEN